MDDAAAGAGVVPKQPKYTRTQLWILISLGISMPAMLVTALLHDVHLFKLATIGFCASMAFVCLVAVRTMRSSGQVYWRGWGYIYKDKSPILWTGVSGVVWLTLIVFGAGVIATLLSLV